MRNKIYCPNCGNELYYAEEDIEETEETICIDTKCPNCDNEYRYYEDFVMCRVVINSI